MLLVLVQVKLMKQQMVRQAPLPTLLASGSIWVSCLAARFQDVRPVKENQMEMPWKVRKEFGGWFIWSLGFRLCVLWLGIQGVVISFAFSGVRQELN